MFVGVIAASVAIEISPSDSYDDSYAAMKKCMTVQLPIKGLKIMRYDTINKQF